MRLKSLAPAGLLAILAACSSPAGQSSTTAAADSDSNPMPASYHPASVCIWRFVGSNRANEGTAAGSWLYMSNDGWCSTTTSFIRHHFPFTPGMEVTAAPQNGTVKIVPGRTGVMHVAYRSAEGYAGADAFAVTVSVAPQEIVYPFNVLIGRPTVIDGGPAIAVDKEPPAGALRLNEKILVGSSSCPAGQIQEVIGGSNRKNIPRVHKCIPTPTKS